MRRKAKFKQASIAERLRALPVGGGGDSVLYAPGSHTPDGQTCAFGDGEAVHD